MSEHEFNALGICDIVLKKFHLYILVTLNGATQMQCTEFSAHQVFHIKITETSHTIIVSVFFRRFFFHSVPFSFNKESISL